jgi:hypothetical protein
MRKREDEAYVHIFMPTEPLRFIGVKLDFCKVKENAPLEVG